MQQQREKQQQREVVEEEKEEAEEAASGVLAHWQQHWGHWPQQQQGYAVLVAHSGKWRRGRTYAAWL